MRIAGFVASSSVIRVARQNGAGAVELFEGDNEGEFVLEGQGAEGPREVGLIEEALVVAIGPADEEGHIACRLLPLANLGGKFAAGERVATLVKNHAEASFTADEQVGAFAGLVGRLDGEVFDRGELGQPPKILLASGLGVGESGLAHGEEEPFHGCGVEGWGLWVERSG